MDALIVFGDTIGVANDASIVRELLTANGFTVFDKPRSGAYFLIVYIEHADSTAIRYASKFKIFIPNVELLTEWDVRFMRFMDYVLYKNAFTKDFLSKIVTDRGLYTKFTTKCSYNSRIKKDMMLVGHFAGTSYLKNTLDVLKNWIANDGFTHINKDIKLVVTRKVVFHTKYDKQLNAYLETLPFEKIDGVMGIKARGLLYKNIYLFNHLPETEYKFIQSKTGLHLCPSVMEGYGHYINEGRCMGGVVITTNAPPMNELVTDTRFLIDVKYTESIDVIKWAYGGVSGHLLDGNSFKSVLTDYFKMSDTDINKVSMENRKNYGMDTKWFETSFTEMLNALKSVNYTQEYVFNRIYKNKIWMDRRNQESPSGSGSTLSSTTETRKIIKNIINAHDIKSIYDAACGDMTWMPHLLKEHPNIKYFGGDASSVMIKQNQQRFKGSAFKQFTFKQINFVTDKLPPADLIIVRDVLQHLPDEDVLKALANFSKAGKYILITNYLKTASNDKDIIAGDARYLNLYKSPVNLYSGECFDEKVEDKTLCLWKLPFNQEFTDRITGKIDKTGGSNTNEYMVGDNYTKYHYSDKYVMQVQKTDHTIQETLKMGYLFGMYNTMMLNSFADKDYVALDVGANIGCIAIPLSRMVKTVHAFEPFDSTFDVLTTNALANNADNIKLHHTALGHTKTTSVLSAVVTNTIRDRTSRTSQFIENVPLTGNAVDFGSIQLGSGGQVVKMTTMDSLKLPRVDIIKVDVEGAEPLVFYGGRKTIAKFKPIILFELNHRKLPDDYIKTIKGEIVNFDIFKFCYDLGYTTIIEGYLGEDFMLIHPKYKRIHDDPMVKFNKIKSIKYTKLPFDFYRFIKPKWN